MEYFFNEGECIKAKGLLGKNGIASKIWHNYFAPSTKIGNCTNLYRTLKPENCKDFFNKYIKYAEENADLPIKERGLNYEELFSLAVRYKKAVEDKTNLSYEVDTYFNDALCHIIVETWQGQQIEGDFIHFLESLGYNCSKFDGTIDATYGVDIKVTRDDGKVSAIQIKPISFFKSNRGDVQSDRIALCEKYEEAYKKFGFKTYYAIYIKDNVTGEVKWVKNGNGFRFRINELFNYDPNDIRGTFTRITLPEIYEKLPV